MLRFVWVLTIPLVLAGCNLPRGAGFQSEVLARTEGEATDFVVYEVTRASLPRLQTWPTRNVPLVSWPASSAQPASLLIAPGDLVQLTIWDAEENSVLAGPGQRATPLQDVEVSADGMIFVPYIGELQVSGLAPDVARARIEEELIPTIPTAQVQLVVKAGRANSATLTGGVGGVGIYEIPGRDFRILDLLSRGGGASRDLVNPRVRLSRGGRVYSVPLQRLLDEPQLDIPVQGGDRVQVVADGRNFFALGATGSQSVFAFPDEEVTALEALAMIGGVAATSANPKGVLILREYDTDELGDGQSAPPIERVVFMIDLTKADGLFSAGRFLVQDGDLVYGTESPLGVALTAVRLATSLQSTATTFGVTQ